MYAVHFQDFHERNSAYILSEHFDHFRNKFVYSVLIVKFNFKRQYSGHLL